MWLGLGLAALITVIIVLVFGHAALIPGIVFGGLGALIQVIAVTLVKPVLKAPLRDLLIRWGWGMGLRLAGVILFAVAVLIRPDIFPPLPTGLAYIGVVLPLLFMEIRLLR
jgi:hypothetical protein